MFSMISDLVEWIEQERSERDWTIGEVARRSGLSSGGITNVLNHKWTPGHRFVIRIANAFEYPPDALLRIAGLLPPAPDATPSLQEAQLLFSKLSDAEQGRFLAMMRVIVEMEREPTKKTVR